MQQLKPVAWLVLAAGIGILLYGVQQYYEYRPESIIDRADRLARMGEPKSFSDAAAVLSEGFGAVKDAAVGPLYLKRAKEVMVWGAIIAIGGIVFLGCVYRAADKKSMP